MRIKPIGYEGTRREALICGCEHDCRGEMMISLALFFFFDFENTLPTLRFSCIMEMGIVAFNFNWICFLSMFSIHVALTRT